MNIHRGSLISDEKLSDAVAPASRRTAFQTSVERGPRCDGRRLTFMRGEELITVAITQKSILIEESLRFLRFEPIPVLFYLRDGEEVEEFSPNRGIMISSRTLPPTTSAGNRVANSHEIWLHSDGTFHKYLWCADWESMDCGCSQPITSRQWRTKKCL
jgi:hypothetical protein